MNANYTDVLLCKKSSNELIVVKIDDIAAYPESYYTPIGVVVIPSSHDVYGDGSCGVMSIVEMNCDTPTIGSASYQKMYWGVYGTNISSLHDFCFCVMLESMTTNRIEGIHDGCYLPSTNSYNPSYGMSADGIAEYREDAAKDYPAPSPYLSDGSRNPSYYLNRIPSSDQNCLSDLDGRANTDKILTVRGYKDYTTWKPLTYIEADYPAASCCDMFSTVGTKQGDWYLPSCGELGYLIVRFKEINDTLMKLKSYYSNTPIITLGINNAYWSSTEYGMYSVRAIDTYFCYTQRYSKNDGGRAYLRSFLKVSL